MLLALLLAALTVPSSAGATMGGAAAPTGVPAAALIGERRVSGASAGLEVKRVLDLEHPLRHGEYAWDDTGIPSGPLVITADLEAETMSVFRNGYEIGTAAILYGAPGHPTPLGSFRIKQMRARHVSNLYNAPMPYMMRLTDDGVAIHGSNVAYGYASHGCLGVPTPFARLLFEQAKPGDRVFITRGKMLAAGDTLVGRGKNTNRVAQGVSRAGKKGDGK